MKNNLFFIIFFLLIGCIPKTEVPGKITCPSVLFSSEHKKYIDSNTEEFSIDNISFVAEINNFAYSSDCKLKQNQVHIELSVLFIVKPYIDQIEEIKLPFYIATLDNDDSLINMQYFITNALISKDSESKKLIETEITSKIKFQIPFVDLKTFEKNTLIIGFMIDKEKLQIIN